MTTPGQPEGGTFAEQMTVILHRVPGDVGAEQPWSSPENLRRPSCSSLSIYLSLNLHTFNCAISWHFRYHETPLSTLIGGKGTQLGLCCFLFILSLLSPLLSLHDPLMFKQTNSTHHPNNQKRKLPLVTQRHQVCKSGRAGVCLWVESGTRSRFISSW